MGMFLSPVLCNKESLILKKAGSSKKPKPDPFLIPLVGMGRSVPLISHSHFIAA